VKVLCINAGSSSLKAALFDDRLHPVEARQFDVADVAHVDDSLDEVLSWSGGTADSLVVGHRVVHGGPAHTRHVVLDAAVRRDLEAAVPFAPLHLPAALTAIDAVAARLGPDVRQVACFDTAFHRGLPEVTRRLPLPSWVHDEGVHRYGFHGLSCECVVDTVGGDGRLIVAHLGSGASLTAVRDGRSVDTTMGLTPTGGILMATRTGDLDPGVLVYLARRHRMGADELEQLVDHEGGLQGLAGAHDMEALVATGDPAVDAFCYRARLGIGAFAAALGGLDTLVFTAGIGEHSPIVRSRICSGLEHLGVALDDERNRSGAGVISSSEVTVRVVATDENLMIARHARRLVS
jgi:acetate kinase